MPPDEFDESSVKPVVRRRRATGGTPDPQATGPSEPTAPGVATPEVQPAPPERPSPRPSAAPEPSRPQQQGPQQQGPQQQGPQQQRQRPQRPAQQRPRQPRPGSEGEPTGPSAPRRRPPSDGAAPRPAPQRARPVEDDGEYVLLPPESRGSGRKLVAVAGSVLLVLAILIGGLMVWASRQVDPSGEPGELVASIEVPSGSSTDSIATILEDAGVISSARLFRYYVGWKGAGPWDAGEYVEFRTDSSFDEAIEVLDAGPVPAQSKVVRVTEGRRLEDALVQISEQMPSLSVETLLSTLSSGSVTSAYKPPEVTSWEGLLFPDTYEFDEDASAQEVLQTMASKMEEVLDELGYDKAEALQGRSAYELITIASLIEKETGAPADERGKISRVISNRLDSGETLGIDAAVLYGLGRASGELTQSDLDRETPYNTRVVKGLPPTPIALPGEASLAAAIAPSDGEWRYYVLISNDPPTHFFTDDYDEFLEAKSDAQADGVF